MTGSASVRGAQHTSWSSRHLLRQRREQQLPEAAVLALRAPQAREVLQAAAVDQRAAGIEVVQLALGLLEG